MPKVSAHYKEQRRQQILDAAMDCFIGKGYQLTTINDISSRCGLSVGALYRYYSSKSLIMIRLIEDRLGRMPLLLARVSDPVEDPWERIVRCIDLFVSLLRLRHPANGRLLLVAWAEAIHDPLVRKGLHGRYEGLVSYLEGAIRAGIAQGRFRPDIDTRALAALMLCMADGVAFYWVGETPDLELRSMRQTTLAMLKAYLENGAPL
jgi:AcrR family transcriptional regulator